MRFMYACVDVEDLQVQAYASMYAVSTKNGPVDFLQ